MDGCVPIKETQIILGNWRAISNSNSPVRMVKTPPKADLPKETLLRISENLGRLPSELHIKQMKA